MRLRIFDIEGADVDRIDVEGVDVEEAAIGCTISLTSSDRGTMHMARLSAYFMTCFFYYKPDDFNSRSLLVGDDATINSRCVVVFIYDI